MKVQIKSRMLSGVVVAMVIGLAAASTFAHDGKAMTGGDMLSKVDTNHDGSISAAEHAAYAQGMFERMDTNHDGMVSKVELDAGMKTMHGEHAKTHSGAAATDHDADDMPASTPASTPPKK